VKKKSNVTEVLTRKVYLCATCDEEFGKKEDLILHISNCPSLIVSSKPLQSAKTATGNSFPRTYARKPKANLVKIKEEPVI
jgi:hypothetical protein